MLESMAETNGFGNIAQAKSKFMCQFHYRTNMEWLRTYVSYATILAQYNRCFPRGGNLYNSTCNISQMRRCSSKGNNMWRPIVRVRVWLSCLSKGYHESLAWNVTKNMGCVLNGFLKYLMYNLWTSLYCVKLNAYVYTSSMNKDIILWSYYSKTIYKRVFQNILKGEAILIAHWIFINWFLTKIFLFVWKYRKNRKF